MRNLSKVKESIEKLYQRNQKITASKLALATGLSIGTIKNYYRVLGNEIKVLNERVLQDKTKNGYSRRLGISRSTYYRYRDKRNSIPINQVFNEDCVVTMKRLPENCLDISVQSPPFDSLRTYDGYHQFDYRKVAKELYRITKPGGVMVWVVGDSVINGSESGTSFRQALAFIKAGFNLWDTMIYEKASASFPAKTTGKRYSQIFEYMFVFSKGRPKTVNLISDRRNRWSGWTNWGKKTHRLKNGNLVQTKDISPVPEFSPRTNIWRYAVGKGYISSDKSSHDHPAIFPEKLAEDHIVTWSNKGDVVADFFAGSGTTLRMAKKHQRHFIGSEINPAYYKQIMKSVM